MSKSSAQLLRELAARRFVDKYTPTFDFDGTPKDEAFPGGVEGRVAGINGLYRTNWFDGRFLTADALRADQTYGDTRARLVAQIHPPGVAWGLTLDVRDPVPVEPTVQERPPNPGGEQVGGRLEVLCERYHGALEESGADAAEKAFRPRVEEFGVKWDDFLAWCTWEPTADASGGWDVGTRATLAPGLAFDDLGRPAVVGAPFGFTFTDLIQRYRTRPSVVIGGGTAFTPCACIEELPPGTVPAGPSLPEGPYLLLIFPIQTGEGKARVYGDACAATGSAEACEVEGWRGGFELRLSRLKVEVPQESWSGAWDLRGMLSAWYFDLYEHDLRTRWTRTGASAPYFPADPSRWKGPGPSARVEAGVPLALVYIGSDGSVLFLDSWIPRRPITATGSAEWAANARGAPTPAARVARVHQFQSMLIESLADAPQFGTGVTSRNLYARGFRHLPPWGFLPIPEPPPLTTDQRNGLAWLATEAQAIEAAKKAAATWFAGTNVVPIYHVAIHDDDVFEDLRDADEKDPVSLRLRDKTTVVAELFATLSKRATGSAKPTAATVLVAIAAKLLSTVAAQFGDLTIEQLVNREVEVVKVIIPMEPLRRTFPIVGRVSEDPLVGLFSAWSTATASDRLSKAADFWLGDFLGAAAAPRRFVVYVKQRMVVLAFLYLVLDFVLDLLAVVALFVGRGLLGSTKGTAAAGTGATSVAGTTAASLNTAEESVTVDAAGIPTTTEPRSVAIAMVANSFVPARERDPNVPTLTDEQLQAFAAPLKARVSDTARAVLATDGAREVAATTLRGVFPELALPGTWTAYKREAKSHGADAAITALAAEHQGFGALKAVSLVLPAAETKALVASLAETRAPSGQGELGAATPIVTNTFYADGYTRGSAAEVEALATLRAAYGERPATEIAEGAPAGATIDVLLAGSVDDAARVVGQPNAARAVSTIATDARTLTAAAKAVAAAPATTSETFWTAVEAARGDGGDYTAALAKVAKSGDAEAKAAASALTKAAPALGQAGLAALAARYSGR